MGIANKTISTKFLNIIIRTNHGQTEIVMQYCGLRSSVTCVTTSSSNDGFALRRIEPINRWLMACGMLFHSCTSASRSSCSVSGGFWRWRTRLPCSSHKCSIGDRYDDNADEGRTRMWFWLRKSWQTRATWHIAWSCWKTWSKFRWCRKGRTIGSRISSLYCMAFNVPCVILSWVRSSWQIPAQTNTSASKTVGLVHTVIRKNVPHVWGTDDNVHRGHMSLFNDWSYNRTLSSESRFT